MDTNVSRCITGTTRLARYLVQFFAGKTGADGKPIPFPSIVNANLIAQLAKLKEEGVSFGISSFHRILDVKNGENSADNIRYLLAVIYECKELRIPSDVVMALACAHAYLVGRWEFASEEDLTEEDIEDLDNLEEEEDTEVVLQE